MQNKMLLGRVIGLVVTTMFIVSASACGAVQELLATPTSTPTNTSLPTPTHTPTLADTPMPTSTPTLTNTPTRTPTATLSPTATRKPAPPSATLKPSLPTYSKILQTYPKGVRLCSTNAIVESALGSRWSYYIPPGGGIDFVNNQFQIQCYGTKITLEVSVTSEGKTFLPGTKLTVDKDLKWIEVSSWD